MSDRSSVCNRQDSNTSSSCSSPGPSCLAICATIASGSLANRVEWRAAHPSSSRSLCAGWKNRAASTSSKSLVGCAARPADAASLSSRSARTVGERPKWLTSPSPRTQQRPSPHCAVEPSHSSAPAAQSQDAMNARRSSDERAPPATNTSHRTTTPRTRHAPRRSCLSSAAHHSIRPPPSSSHLSIAVASRLYKSSSPLPSRQAASRKPPAFAMHRDALET
eukprot:scaffold36245_cov26-Tisochrysis_lutea.AAC.1